MPSAFNWLSCSTSRAAQTMSIYELVTGKPHYVDRLYASHFSMGLFSFPLALMSMIVMRVLGSSSVMEAKHLERPWYQQSSRFIQPTAIGSLLSQLFFARIIPDSAKCWAFAALLIERRGTTAPMFSILVENTENIN
ncbi:hypothetical protein AHF37_06194 [Paragonimus kellicotti]|nr:hypothetical protein AHF37_06194 [Paragonimus kellicotti]